MAKGRNSKAKIQSFISRDDVSIVANIEENYILTTEDKIKILYSDYKEAGKYSGEFWTFLGLFIALLTTVLTCEFKSVFGLSESVIESAYVLATAITFLLTIKAVVQWIANRKKMSFEYFISQLQGNECNNENKND